MNKYNIEDQLADKLGNRSITPTDNAWERIAFNRQQQAGKKQKKKRGFFIVAAVLLMFLTCGYFVSALFRTEEILPKAPQVVDGAEPVQSIKVKTNALPESMGKVIFPVKQEQPEALAQHVNTFKEPSDKMPVGKTGINERNVLLAISPVEINTAETNIKATTPVVAESRSQEDILLEKAMKDLAESKQFKSTTNQAALLKEVESEMDEYYREKALRFFSLKYKKIRIVVKDNH